MLLMVGCVRVAVPQRHKRYVKTMFLSSESLVEQLNPLRGNNPTTSRLGIWTVRNMLCCAK